MKSTERQKFEERWQEAFEGSEMTPSDSVWTNIDLKLDNEKMKRRVVYYQRLAAATILFALLTGVGGVKYFNSIKPHGMAIQSTAIDSEGTRSEVSSSEGMASNENSSTKNQADLKENSFVIDNQLSESTSNLNLSKGTKGAESDGTKNNATNDTSFLKGTSISVNNGNQTKYVDDNSIMNVNRYLPLASQPFKNLSSYSSPVIPENQLTVDEDGRTKENKTENTIVASKAPGDVSDEIIEPAKKKGERLWLSFGAAAGSYNPGTSSASSTQTMDFSKVNSSYVSQVPQSSRSAVGTAYSLGVSVGKKITDRLIVHTGINYLNQVINYTSNFATQANANRLSASVSDYASQNSAPVSVVQPYKVSSSSEFVSIPLQAGYLLIDRKVGLQLNAGVASDIFLKNTLKDQSGQSNKYSQGSGEESPYRSLNWAGLASTELSYKVAKQYRISLMPGIRYSFQPALKAISGRTANPLVLDIGFRFRYIFE